MPNDIKSIPDKPGLELDGLVAEVVMSIPVIWRGGTPFNADRELGTGTPRQYSTTGDGMMLIVEKMSKQGYPMDLDNNHFEGRFFTSTMCR